MFLACQWTDEQTGGHCPISPSTSPGTRHKWFTFTNGAHIDSLDPATFNRWYDFLELYVAQRAPSSVRRGEGARADALPGGDGNQRGDAARPTRSRQSRLRRARSPRSSAAADPGPVRQRRGRLDAGRAGARLRAVVPALPDPGHPARSPGTSALAATLAGRQPRSRGADAFTWNARRLARDRLHRQHRRPGRPVDAPRLATTGRRTRRARRCRT